MSTEVINEMHRVLELQKSLNIKEGAPDLELRKDRLDRVCLLYTSPSPRDLVISRMPSSA